jgi:hypothetical protein
MHTLAHTLIPNRCADMDEAEDEDDKTTRVHQGHKSASRRQDTTTTISPTEAAPQHVARTRQGHTATPPHDDGQTRDGETWRRRDGETWRRRDGETAFDKTQHRLLTKLNTTTTTPTDTYLSVVHT